MTELKIGFRAVFYVKDEVSARMVVRETYSEAEKDIENEHKNIEQYKIKPFTYAKVEKVYYRH